ncbi:MAG: iron chelate uptake ABC transporter family permease subunit, partial [Actinomycetota bacterium]|nr:iron chelate uptake ABC transporter family permease subunit [Actinomycetota bacterium]
MAVVLLASIVLAATFGPADVSPAEALASIAHHVGLPVDAPERLTDAIVWELRMPRTITAAVVGAGLGLAGAVMQSLTRNPLADPYLLGLSSGASLGAVAVLVLGAAVALPAAAFAGALGALALALAIARAAGALTPTRM